MIYSNWLPSSIVQEAKLSEPAKFIAAVHAFKQAADAAKADQGNPNAWQVVLGQLLDDIKTLISSKTVFPYSAVRLLVSELLDVVLLTSDDVEVQVRVCELLNHVLRHYRHNQHVGLQIPWRPIYDMLQQMYGKPSPHLKGTFLEHVQQGSLFTMVARARRFFPPGAAAEIYDLLRPALVFGDPMSTPTHLALGWLVLFFPTKQLPQVEPQTAQVWAAEWLGMWGRLVNCSYWDTHWLYLVARAVKDDWKGVIDWGPHIPDLYTHILACFKVPVGTATAGSPSNISAPHKAVALFGGKLDQVDDQSKSAAKLAVHLLKQPLKQQSSNDKPAALSRALSLGLNPAASGSGVSVQGVLSSKVQPATDAADSTSSASQSLCPVGSCECVEMSPAVVAAADALDRLVQLLEQYCHPSNTGSWSSDLAVFLRHGVHYFMKVIGRQCGMSGWPGEQVVVGGAAQRYIKAAVKLAARGQFSKKDSLVSASCKALCHLSYVWPGAVLPLVLHRFQSALATATAMHQLPTAITSLALCVRPLLLAGWHTAEETTQQIIAEAMMAVLPGIDANDEGKTAAVFQFYTAVLSSIPALHGLAEEEEQVMSPHGPAAAGDAGFGDFGAAGAMDGVDYSSISSGASGPVYRLPLYLDDWVEQVMERLFTLLSNLDTGPSHRSTDQQAKPEILLQSTHLGKDTMYHSFFQHLVLRIPPRLADHVVALLGKFATSTALPTVALEASSMFRSSGVVRPRAAVEKLVKPLIARIRAELPEPGVRSVSRSIEDSLTWHLVLLGSTVGGLPPAILEPLLPQLEQLVDECLKVPSRVVHNWCSMVLSGTLGVMSGWFIDTADQGWAQQGGLLLPSGVQLWIDRQGVGWNKPSWSVPSESHMAQAARLADKYLESAAQQLIELCGTSSDATGSSNNHESDPVVFRTKCRALLATMAATVIGLMSRLRDFEGFTSTRPAAAAAGGDHDGDEADQMITQNLQVVGNCIAPVGAAGVRNRAAAALIVAIRHLRGGDRELLEQASYTSLLLMCPGMLEQAIGGQGRQGGKDDGAIIDEPAAATAYILAAQAAAAGTSGSERFVKAFSEDEQRAHAEAAAVAEAAASDAGSSSSSDVSPPSPPGAGSWGSEWRWRRRTSPIAVMDRIRRMVLWRCAQAAARSGPPVNATGAAAAAAQVQVEQLPTEYLELFRELMILSMQPNAAVRSSAMPTLHACIKRFPCLAELVVPEVFAALAGVQGPLLGIGGKNGSSRGGAAAAAVGSSVDGVDSMLLQPDVLKRFYSVTLLEAMRNQQADVATAAAAGGEQQHTSAAAAAAMAALTAAAKAASDAGATGSDNEDSKAAATAAAASLAAANAAAAASASGSSAVRSVAEESENDGRVSGACAVLAGCLDAWRVIFRDPLLFQGFAYALMASRTHSSNMCLKNIQMLIMQVMSRFKLPPGLIAEGEEYQHFQTAIISLAEPGARVTWRYSVLSNMLLMFAAPPASSSAAVPLLRHCLGLLRSDMLLLRQVGGAGLWLMMAQMMDMSDTNQRKQIMVKEMNQWLCSSPDLGEVFVKLLVLDHSRLDASEAAKGSRGSAAAAAVGGLMGAGGGGGLLSGLLGMTAEELMGAMVAAAVERYDRWPGEGGRPAATTDGLFETGHARLVRLMALLCPQPLCQALQQPLTQRIRQYTTPTGATEKAEVAAVAETLAGLLAAAAPVAAAAESDGSSSSTWVIELFKEGLIGSSLDMCHAWGAAVWYAVDHLLDTITAASSSSSEEVPASAAAAMDVEDVAATAALSPAAEMLQQVLDAVLTAVPGAASLAAAPRQQQQQQVLGLSSAAAGAAGAGASIGDVKRLKYLLSCLPPIRKLGPLGTTTHTSQQQGTAAEAEQYPASSSNHLARYVACYTDVGVRGTNLPKSTRVFLAAVIQELQGLLQVEQPTAMRDCIGALLADIAGIFTSPPAIMLPAGAAAAAARGGSSGDISSGCSSPVEIEVPSPGAGNSEVLLLNSSMSSLRAQAAKLLQLVVDKFATHAALLESLKNSGSSTTPSGSSTNLAAVAAAAAAAAAGGGSPLAARTSDRSDDVVMVDATEGTAPGSSSSSLTKPDTSTSLSATNPASLAQSLTTCGIGLQMAMAMFESGETASLRPLLSQLLPGVLALQELSGPGIQQLVSEAKGSFVLYKYLPVGDDHVNNVTNVILETGSSDAWSSRAAALVYLQVFWFRHCYLLGEQDMQRLQSFVVCHLQDPKVEVRSLSAATLSGIIKALPAHDNEQLRRQLITQAQALFTTSKSAAGRAGRRQAVGMPVVAAAAVLSPQQQQQQQQQGSVFLSEAQAVVQGLKAFVLSSPYDVPDWMPEVLMTLVSASNSRNPLVRRDASKALSEFKRTHEEDALDQLRDMLGEEQWEAMTQVTSSASYFV